MTTDSHHHPSGMGAPVGPGLELRVRTTDTGSISVHQGVLGPGDEIPLHVHDGADQVLYIVDGEVEVTIGTDTFLAAAGDLVSKPHGVAHGFANRGERTAIVLEITSDDSFERLTLAAAELSDPTRFEALQAEHGVHPAGA